VVAPVAIGLALAGALFAVGRSSAQAAAAEVAVYSPMYTVPAGGPGSAPRLLTAACESGTLLSGGVDGANDPPLHIVYSYPSDATGNPVAKGGQPVAWTIGVVNTDTADHTVHVTATCLAGSSATTTVAAKTSAPGSGSFTLTAACPSATARTGGGYSFTWSATASNNPTPTGSYPTGSRSWTVSMTYLTPVLRAYTGMAEMAVEAPTVYAVCLSGTGAAEIGPARTLDFDKDPPVCKPSGGGFADVCTSYARLDMVCGSGLLAAGGGWRVTEGTLTTTYTMMTDMAGPDAGYDLAALVLTDDKKRFVIQAVPLCLKAGPPKSVPPKTVPTSGGGVALGRSSDAVEAEPGDADTTDWSGPTGIGCLVLLLIAGLGFYFLRGSRRAQPQPAGPAFRTAQAPIPPGTPGRQITVALLEVVVRAQRSAYRISGFREIS
jgi:hypothetical protein